jgi:branched-chain amino acid transport system substrate-binding protein
LSGRFKKRGLLVLVPLLALSLIAAACGGDDDGDGQAAGDCGNTLKLGSLTPLTGELGDFGESWREVTEYGVQVMNDSGALPDGWNVTMVAEDEKTDPEVALRAGRKLIDSDNVSAIVGPTSGPMVALVDLAREKETPVISPASGTVELDDLGGEWSYRLVASDTSDGVAVGKWLSDQGVTSVAVMTEAEESTSSIGLAAKATLEAGGTEVAAEVDFSPGQPSYQAELQQIVDSGAEWTFLAAGQESGATILKEAHQLGMELSKFFLSADMSTQEFIDTVGADILEGAVTESAAPDESLQTYQDFKERFEQDVGRLPEFFDERQYDATILVGLAATATASTCGEDINAQLREVAGPPGQECTQFSECAELLLEGEDVDFFGASGPADFDESGSVAGAYGVLQVENGKWKQIEFFPAEEIQQFKEEFGIEA